MNSSRSASELLSSTETTGRYSSIGSILNFGPEDFSNLAKILSRLSLMRHSPLPALAE